ncbi:carbohydrate binding domain-containing protein [Bacteroidota bacterium]
MHYHKIKRISALLMFVVVLAGLSSVSLLAASETVYFYHDDECGNEATALTNNRLCRVQDLSGNTLFKYDSDGNILEQVNTVNLRNLAPNPGFEAGFDFWTDNSLSITDSKNRFLSGSNSLNVIADESSSLDVRSLEIRLKPNTDYTFSAYLNADPGSVGVSWTLEVLVLDENDVQVGYTNLGGNKIFTSGEANSNWNRKSLSFTTPSNAVKGILVIERSSSNSGTSNFYIDDIQLEEGTSATGFFDNTFVTLYDYDTLNRLATVLSPGGVRSVYSYDGSSRVEEIQLGTGETIEYGYDGSSRVSYVDYNGVMSALYTYSGNDLSTLSTSIIGQGTIFNEIYDYTNGVLDDISDLSGVLLDLVYDNPFLSIETVDDRVYATGLVDTDYNYDSNGNILSVNDGTNTLYTYSGTVNKVTDIGGQAITYDANGNIISNGPKTYGYNYENQLTQVNMNGQIIKYYYDYNGNLALRKAEGRGTIFIYDFNGNLIYIHGDIDSTKTGTPVDSFFCDTQNFDSSRNFIVRANGKIVASLDSSGIWKITGELMPFEAVISDSGNFNVKRSDGTVVFAIDEDGNMLSLNGINEEQSLSMPSGTDHLVIKESGSSTPITHISSQTGLVNIGGCVAEKQTNI